MLKSATLKTLKEIINQHGKFIFEDFQIQSEEYELNIIYEYDDKFIFQIFFPNRKSEFKEETTTQGVFNNRTTINKTTYKDYRFRGTVIPGTISLEEEIEFVGIEEFYKEIKIWLNNLWKEIIDTPFAREYSNSKEEIDKLKTSFDKLEDRFFSKEEKEDLEKRLSDLENLLNKNINEFQTSKEETEILLKELNSDIEHLKLIINTFKKKGWFKAFVNRVYKWYSKDENRKMLKDGIDLIKPLLPEGTDIID